MGFRKRARSPEAIAYAEARKMANRRVAFFGHAVMWASVCVFLLVVAGPLVAVIVALAWGIGLAAHGFFGVLASTLRDRWVQREVKQHLGRSVLRERTLERRAAESKHKKSLEQLSASVAHEIRNPITAAKSLVQQIGEHPKSDENIEYARVALEELDRVERSVSHLLKYAREEELKFQTTHLSDVVESAIEGLRDRLGKTLVKVDTDVDSAVVFEADPEKLRRVVINLVSNALDSLEESEFPDPRVVISGGTNLSGDEVWLRVKDNGPGIEPERLEQIWNPFHTSRDWGTGLGLAITKKIVEGHGGSIAIETELGGGTELILTLPKSGGVE